MSQRVYVAGIGMTPFGKHGATGLKAMAASAINDALADAGIAASDLEAAYMGNAAAAVITGQVLIPGQAVLRGMGIGRIPVVNVENACATSATAFQQAFTMIKAGLYGVVLVAGYEKLVHPDKQRTFSVFQGAIDLENIDSVTASVAASMAQAGLSPDLNGAGATRSVFMDIYAVAARKHMRAYGSTSTHFAKIAAKNSFHGSLNPKAQFKNALTPEEVLAAPTIIDPLTLPMCSPIGDGAAALILMSEKAAARFGVVRKALVRSSVLASGWDGANEGEESVACYAARQAYDASGVGPADLDVVELHDASAPAELMYYEYLGLAEPGGGIALIEDGSTRLGGRIPVNTSGGLLRKGHPIGASGAGQIVELVQQLRGEAGARQVEGARIALAENGGGYIGSDVAAIVVSVLEKA